MSSIYHDYVVLDYPFSTCSSLSSYILCNEQVEVLCTNEMFLLDFTCDAVKLVMLCDFADS